MEALNVAGIVILALVAFAIFAMWDIARQPKPCRWCPHCEQQAAEEKAALRQQRHLKYHGYSQQAAEDCRNDDCPGRRL